MSDNTKTLGSGGMAAFDSLPPALRQALASHPQNMSSEFALAKLREGYTEQQLISMLQKARAA